MARKFKKQISPKCAKAQRIETERNPNYGLNPAVLDPRTYELSTADFEVAELANSITNRTAANSDCPKCGSAVLN